MKTFEVTVETDHIESLAKVSHIRAISELIWNAYDADATKVTIEFEEGQVTKLGLIRVIDNGTGIRSEDAEPYFQSIGGSWKRNKRRTENGRNIHGIKGQGRIKAFALGSTVKWISYCEGENFTITGSMDNLKRFTVSDVGVTQHHGCTVEITGIEKDFPVQTDVAAASIRDMFALQLYENTDFDIIYDGDCIDVRDAIRSVEPVTLRVQSKDGIEHCGQLDIVEWNTSVQRKLMLCLPGRFSFHDIAPGIRAPGFNFTAYLTADHFQTLMDDNTEGLHDFDEASQALIEAAKTEMRSYFRSRESDRSREKIEEWQNAGVYPYAGVAADPVDRNQRQVFDVVALTLSDYSSEFDNYSNKTQRLVFQLLKSTVETGPGVLPDLISEVIGLPPERQQEMAALLRRTTLSAVIESAKAVADRLDFLKALQILIFDPKSKQQLLERSQLHRIIADEPWLFGEQYNLVNDDEDLTSVLRAHLKLLGHDRGELAPTVDETVLDTEGRTGIIDLMLSRRIPLPDDSKRQHLVVELKRPTQKIDDTVMDQVRKYARAVGNDPRFCDCDVEWDFIAVSNEMTDGAKAEANQVNRPPGLMVEYGNPKVRIWIKTWGQIIQEAEGRLKFYRNKLNYQADDENALDYLRSMREELLSPEIRERIRQLDIDEIECGSA